MRPYLAIILDSFREAFASRVLWILLALITLLLLALAPIGYREQATCELSEGDVRDWPHFIEHVAREARAPRPSPSKHLLALCDPSLRASVDGFKLPGEGEVSAAFKMLRMMGEFRKAMNELLPRRDFYNPAAWAAVPISTEEGRELIGRDPARLSAADIGRRNRLLLESAFPDFVQISPPTSIRLVYLGYDFGQPMPVRKASFQRTLEAVVEWVAKWLVGTVGVLIAVLVTASIIPQTFDPGSLNLLLSKPVWRSLLFLAKFLGGCAFILLNAAYLVLGLWLLLGLRFGLWDPQILWSIPIYVFVFAVYYSVSALAGLIWRNAIVSVVVTIVFWLACFLVGVSKSTVEQMVLGKLRIIDLLQAGPTLISCNEIGGLHRWNEQLGCWDEIGETDDEEAMQRRIAVAFMPTVPSELRTLGPVYDEAHDQLLTATRSLRSGQLILHAAPRGQGWRDVRGVAAAMGTRALLSEPDGHILLASSAGLYRIAGDAKQTAQPVEWFGISIPLPSPGAFVQVGPEPAATLLRAGDVAINRDSGELAIYFRGKLAILRRGEDGRYERRLERQLEPGEAGEVVLAFGGETLLAGRADGRIAVYEAGTLAQRGSFAVEGKNQPRFVTAAPGGRYFAIVFHHGRLWVYDRESNEVRQPPVAGRGDFSCCVFPSAEHALAVDRGTRVTRYSLPDWRVDSRFAPPLSPVESVYRYAIQPLYIVFPKPRELDKTVQYLLTGKETAENEPGDMRTAQASLHPWRPVWSSLAFMAAMLGLGCWYLHRQDF